jgi:hypothetical protein
MDERRIFFFHNNFQMVIDTAVLKNGSSAVVLNNPLTGRTYIIYDFSNLLDRLDLMPSSFAIKLLQRCFLQVYKINGEVCIKVFLPEGTDRLESNTDNLSAWKRYTLGYAAAQDKGLFWQTRDLSARLEGSLLIIGFKNLPVKGQNPDGVLRYVGYETSISPGINTFAFPYVPGEKIHLVDSDMDWEIDVNNILKEVD